jgi:ABC-type transport system involved in multi-copper enzyme maturation permease subunit
MKPLILKELREHRVLAIVGLIAFTLLALYTSSQTTGLLVQAGQGQTYDNTINRLQPLVSSDFLLHVGALCALFGSALGWMQVHTERHRDLWAYLVHRPVTPTNIYASKLIAGLFLYLLGAGIPLLLFVCWVQQPGSVAAPFEWAMALPTLTLFCAGIVCYFAAMLIGLRAVRWHGSRALPLGVPFMALSACAGFPGFGTSLTIILICGGVLALATWGAFRTHGQYDGQPAMSKAALTISLTAGCSTIILLGSMLILNSIISRGGREWSSHLMGKDGMLYHVTQTPTSFQVLDEAGKPVLDKAGKPLENEEFNKRLALSLSCYVSTNHSGGNFQRSQTYFKYWKGSAGSIWYYWRQYGRLVGFDTGSRQIIGSLGPDGFSKSLAGDRFADFANWSYWMTPNHLCTDTAVYAINARDRSIQTIFKTDAHDPIMAISSFGGYTPPQNPIVVTKSTIHLIDPDGAKLASIPYKPGFPEYPDIQITQLDQTNSFVFRLNPNPSINEKSGGKLRSQIIWFNQEQGITRQTDIPSPQVQNDIAAVLAAVTSASSPPPVMIFFALTEPSARKVLPFAISYVIISIFIGFWICRRYRLSGRTRGQWLVFLLFTGFPGLLAFICARDWIASESCPACHKPRSVEYEHCEHCQASFPPPVKNGVEIFESVTAE